MSCSAAAPRGWMSHLQVRIWRREGCPAACPSHKLTGESVCLSLKACACVCWLIPGGQGSAQAAAVGKREREDTSFHWRSGKSLLEERVMSQKRAERREGKTKRRRVSGGGTRTGRHTSPLTSHVPPSPFTQLHLAIPFPLLGSQAPPWFLFFFLYFSSAWVSCLFCSTSHSNLKSTFVCGSMHTVTG